MANHVLQSDMWGKVKDSVGTPAIRAGGVLYTKHKIPFTSYFYAYSPRVSPLEIDFEAVKKSLEENSCIAIHFDVPNVIKGSVEENKAVEVFEKFCKKSPRDEFAKGNFFMDISKSEEELLQNMHNKQRYNINYAVKKGVKVRKVENDKDFEIFFDLYKETGLRQGFYYRSRTYLKKVYEIFGKENACDILIAEFEKTPLASWILLTYDNVLYYPYGGSTEKLKNLQANCLIGWEAIKYGKDHNCELFDMWGASENPDDTTDPYFGFSQFKAKFGAKHVTYIDSYDFVLNESVYKIFTLANDIRWKALNILR